MIIGFETTIVVYLGLIGCFRLIWGVSPRAALAFSVASGTILIGIVNQLLLAYLIGQVGLILLLHVLCRRFPAQAITISWFAFLGLVPFNLQFWFGSDTAFASLRENLQGGPDPMLIWTAGATFFVLKSFIGLREARLEGKLHLLPLLAGLTFVPAFPAGPIFGSQPFRPERIDTVLSVRKLGIAIMKLGWGGAAFYVFAPMLRKATEATPETALGTVADVYIKLAALFFDFSGYSLMAIAFAAMMGVTLPENFNRPYLATNIQEFWQRWHMSLSSAIGTYLFKPFVRMTGRPQRGIFLAFVAVGLWHEFSLGYLLWGIGHGAALSFAMKPPQVWLRATSILPTPARKMLGWFLTMTWVAALSYGAGGFFGAT